MALEQITRLMQLWARDEGRAENARQITGARSVARDLSALIAERLQEDQAFVSLWETFRREPDERAAELTGALEALVEGDPAFGQRLEAMLAEYHRLPDPTAEVAGVDDTVPGRGEDASQIPVDNQASAPGEKTYLYGNTPDITESEGRTIGLDKGEAMSERKGTSSLKVSRRLPAVFDHVYQAIDTHPVLEASSKTALRRELAHIEALFEVRATPEELDLGVLAKHLRRIKAYSEDIFDLLARRLRASVDVLEKKLSQIEGS